MILRVYKAFSDGTFSKTQLGYINVCLDPLGNLDVTKTINELVVNNYVYGDLTKEGNLNIRHVPSTQSTIHPGKVFTVFDVKRKNILLLAEVKKVPEAKEQIPHAYEKYGVYTWSGGTATTSTITFPTFTFNTTINNRVF